jgi:hypothetical protein
LQPGRPSRTSTGRRLGMAVALLLSWQVHRAQANSRASSVVKVTATNLSSDGGQMGARFPTLRTLRRSPFPSSRTHPWGGFFALSSYVKHSHDLAEGLCAQWKGASPAKLHQRLAADVPNTTRPVHLTNFSEPRPAIKPPASPSESVLPPEPISNTASVSQPEPNTQTVSRPDPNFAPQSGTALQSDAVPLPTRKPEKRTLRKAYPSKAVSRRTIRWQVVREPKPMRFGSFGYRYTGSAE